MAHFKTVADFMKSVPAALKHEELYLAYHYGNKTNKPDIDMVAWEDSTVGLGERNILLNLGIPNKFVCTGMDDAFEITSYSLAKSKGSTPGIGTLKHARTLNDCFTMEESIELVAQAGNAYTSGRKGLVVPEDEPLYRELSSALAGISSKSLTSPALSYVGERIVARQDLRHMFLKAYLMLMSYNLAMVSGIEEYEYSDIKSDVKTEVVGEAKLCVLMAYPVAIDLDHFTIEEAWLLAEMADSYPKRRYGNGNIYNNIVVDEDVVAFTTSNETFDWGINPGYGSPERMWSDIVSIAVKLDALEDLREVVRDFRGVPGMLRTIKDYTRREVYELVYPSSYSLLMCIESLGNRNARIKVNCGYYATSKCLVADLLLSRMMDLSSFCLIEEFGGLGRTGVPSGDPMRDPYFNSNMRNLGLKNEDEKYNALLLEWRGVRGCSMPVGCGGKLKEYVQRMCVDLLENVPGVLHQQLLYALPYSAFRNTTWAVIRGWRFQEFEFRAKLEDRVLINQLVKAFTWVMGVSDDLPLIGLNALGQRQEKGLSAEEMAYVALASGQYDIGLVRHTIGGELLPRTDEYELSMAAFYSTRFPGVRCTIVFDSDGSPEMVVEEKMEHVMEMVTLGHNKGDDEAEDGEEELTYGGSFRRDRHNTVLPGGEGEAAEKTVRQDKMLPKARGQGSNKSKKEKDKPGSNTSAQPPGGSGARQKKMSADAGGTNRSRDDAASTSSVGATQDEVASFKKFVAEGSKEVWDGDRFVIDLTKLDDSAVDKLQPPRMEEAMKVVKITERGNIPFVMNPPVAVEDGREVGVEVELSDGGSRHIVARPSPTKINPNNFRGFRIRTPADGKCGLHAVVADWVMKGHIPKEHKDRVFEKAGELVGSVSFHAAEELAGVCSLYQMGLGLINLDQKIIQGYGLDGKYNNVYVTLKDGHYETFHPSDDGTEGYTGFKYQEVAPTPWATYEGLKWAQKNLKSDYIVDLSLANAFDRIRKSATGSASDKYHDARPKSPPKSAAGSQKSEPPRTGGGKVAAGRKGGSGKPRVKPDFSDPEDDTQKTVPPRVKLSFGANRFVNGSKK